MSDTPDPVFHTESPRRRRAAYRRPLPLLLGAAVLAPLAILAGDPGHPVEPSERPAVVSTPGAPTANPSAPDDSAEVSTHAQLVEPPTTRR